MIDYYAPWEITFRPWQVMFCIENLDLLREGKYPSDPKETGYTAAPGGKGVRASATFEKPCQLAGEIDWRLERCGLEGKLLVAEIHSGRAHYLDLSHEARQALKYCSGWKRKRQTFAEWKADRKYKQKAIQDIAFSGRVG